MKSGLATRQSQVASGGFRIASGGSRCSGTRPFPLPGCQDRPVPEPHGRDPLAILSGPAPVMGRSAPGGPRCRPGNALPPQCRDHHHGRECRIRRPGGGKIRRKDGLTPELCPRRLTGVPARPPARGIACHDPSASRSSPGHYSGCLRRIRSTLRPACTRTPS